MNHLKYFVEWELETTNSRNKVDLETKTTVTTGCSMTYMKIRTKHEHSYSNERVSLSTDCWTGLES